MQEKRNDNLISIIIPVYNVSRYIERCISSVMGQTYSNIECILVDDASIDDSILKCQQMIDDYKGPIRFVILHHSQNKGASAARNTGIKAATGAYFFFLDSDDEITTDCIEELTKPLLAEKYDLIVGNFEKIDKYNHIVYKDLLKVPHHTVLRNNDILHSYQKNGWYAHAINKLYRAKLIHNNHVLFHEGIIHEDVLWSFNIACISKSLCSVNRNTYVYLKREDSVMNTRTIEKKTKASYEIVIEMGKLVNIINLYNRDVHEIIQANLIWALKYYLHSYKSFIEKYITIRH